MNLFLQLGLIKKELLVIVFKHYTMKKPFEPRTNCPSLTENEVGLKLVNPIITVEGNN
jgi:hypothetical protein